MTSNSASLSALVSLINDATSVVEAHFKASAKPYVPSLEDTEEHPLDVKLYSPELRKAVQTIEGACAQLCATVAKPSHSIVTREMEMFSPTCLNVALRLKIADVLLNKPDGLHISELASKVNTDENKLGRILRLLATRHVFREVSSDTFANNRLSMQLLSSNPLWDLGLHFTEQSGKFAGELARIMQDPEWYSSRDPRRTALNRYTGFEGDLFEYFEQNSISGAEMGTRFGIAMMGWGTASEAGSIIYEYPWDKLAAGASVCDVGGGIGNITMQLARAHPHLQLKLQDLPARISQAKYEIWPEKCPEAIAEGRIHFQPMDFFLESPISGCDIYYIKNIIHDWPDDDCVKILKGVRKAMSPNSRVLIHEYIVQHANRVHTKAVTQPQAPEPLLANYGAGRLRQYNLDMVVLSLLNARERTLEDLVKLGQAADLRFVKLWDFGEMAAVEYRTAQGRPEDKQRGHN